MIETTLTATCRFARRYPGFLFISANRR